MINETMLFRHIQRKIPKQLFETLSNETYMDILNEETLYDFSEYYPKIINGVEFSKSDLIKEKDYKQRTGFNKYQIPNPGNREIIGISEFIHPYNFNMGSLTNNFPSIHTLIATKSASFRQISDISYTAKFEPPDILEISPTPTEHVDFCANLQVVRHLYEIPLYYRRDFLSLYLYDVKSYFYDQFKSIAEEGTWRGIQVNSYISDYGDAEDKKNELLELFAADYFKDPHRLSEVMMKAHI